MSLELPRSNQVHKFSWNWWKKKVLFAQNIVHCEALITVGIDHCTFISQPRSDVTDLASWHHGTKQAVTTAALQKPVTISRFKWVYFTYSCMGTRAQETAAIQRGQMRLAKWRWRAISIYIQKKKKRKEIKKKNKNKRLGAITNNSY